MNNFVCLKDHANNMLLFISITLMKTPKPHVRRRRKILNVNTSWGHSILFLWRLQHNDNTFLRTDTHKPISFNKQPVLQHYLSIIKIKLIPTTKNTLQADYSIHSNDLYLHFRGRQFYGALIFILLKYEKYNFQFDLVYWLCFSTGRKIACFAEISHFTGFSTRAVLQMVSVFSV